LTAQTKQIHRKNFNAGGLKNPFQSTLHQGHPLTLLTLPPAAHFQVTVKFGFRIND